MASQSPNMKARSYSADELLCLRTSLPIIDCVLQKLSKNAGIAGIVRIPEEALKETERLFCKSQSLIDVTNKRKIPPLIKKYPARSSSGESEDQIVSAAYLTRGFRSPRWQLRTRDSSDYSAQPVSAPTDVAVQQSENFQRFYRAVISPTHVRVTAGGRIVPNTRATAQPEFEWNAEKFFFEPHKSFLDIEPNNIQSTTLLQGTSLPVIFPQLAPESFSPICSFPSQESSSYLAAMAARTLRESVADDSYSPESAQASTLNKDATAPTALQGALQQPIKISPPNQFDQSKPFMYNGHLVYPVPHGFHPPPNALPIPITMLGNSPVMPQHSGLSANCFVPPQLHVPLRNHTHPQATSAMGQNMPLMIHNPIQSLENSSPMASYMPLPTMVSISEVTKCQIQGLRNHLKYIDNQVANNRHQIDEVYMERQRNAVKSHIEKMECLLDAQLNLEGSSNTEIHLGAEQSGDVNSTAGCRQLEGNDWTGDGQFLDEDATKSPAQESTANFLSKQIRMTRDVQAVENIGTAYLPSRSEPVTKSRLTAAAAMAPPFQPRAQVAAAQASQAQEKNNRATLATGSSAQNIATRTRVQVDPKPLSKSPYDRAQAGYSGNSSPGHANLTKAHSMHEPQVQTKIENRPANFQRSNTFHGLPANVTGPVIAPAVPQQAVPYLVGILPRGMRPSEATSTDLVYSRPLTDEEVRARHLYWGKAPRSVQSGLPKFDGKDFYPPSPVKEVALLANTSSVANSNNNGRHVPIPLPEFEQPSTDQGGTVHHTSHTLQLPAGLQKLVSSPTQMSLNSSITGHRPASPRPSKYKQDSSTFPNWSSNLQHAKDYQRRSLTPPDVPTIADTGILDDFSHLFLERGVPGYKSPSPTGKDAEKSRVKIDGNSYERPVPVKNVGGTEETVGGGESDEFTSLDSWGLQTRWIPVEPKKDKSTEQDRNLFQADTSAAEIHLPRDVRHMSPKHSYGTSFAERVADVSSVDKQSLFLQNLLRNDIHKSMAAPALSGAVSSATAQGYLPHYGGTAAASLTPTMLNIGDPQRSKQRPTAKTHLLEESGTGIAPLIANNFLPENRPLNPDRPQRSSRPSLEISGAEGYMRYLAQKADEDLKIIEQGWNANTNGIGPIMGSDW